MSFKLEEDLEDLDDVFAEQVITQYQTDNVSPNNTEQKPSLSIANTHKLEERQSAFSAETQVLEGPSTLTSESLINTLNEPERSEPESLLQFNSQSEEALNDSTFNVLPATWITPIKTNEHALRKKLANGTFTIDVTESDQLKLSTTANVLIEKASMYHFQTGLGSICILNPIPLFERLSGLAFDDTFPLGLDKWFCICLLQCPQSFIEPWGYITYQEASSTLMNEFTDNSMPVQLECMSCLSGVSVTVFAQVETWEKLFACPILDYWPQAQNASPQLFKVNINLFQTRLSFRDFQQLQINDVLLAEHLFISFSGEGQLLLFDKQLKIQLLSETSPYSLQIQEITEIAIPEPSSHTLHYAGVLSHRINSLEKDMEENTEQDMSFENEYGESHPKNMPQEAEQSSHTEHISCAKVAIDACIGSFSIDFTQVSGLQVEDIIALDPNYDGTISLRNQGVEIGTANIVAVNGQLALQIRKLWR